MKKIIQFVFDKILKIGGKYNKDYFNIVVGLYIVIFVGMIVFYAGFRLYFSYSMTGKIICLAGLLIILYCLCLGLIMLISGIVKKKKDEK